MRRSVRIGLVAACLLLAGSAAFVGAARSGMLKPDVADMRTRYGQPGSRYETIGGQPLHYVVEGNAAGPAIVLVHGSFASLRMWDSWAKALSPRYRVIRFDRPLMGLSGPSADARYDGDAEARLIGALADHLKLGQFALVATSSSGEGAAHYAVTQPERVTALVLANIAAKPLDFAPAHYPAWFKAVLTVDPWLGGWHPQALWRGVLEQNYADPSRISPDLVREWTDLNNLAQGAVRKPRPDGVRSFSGTPADLAAIRAPALLLWSARDPEVPLETHGRFALAQLGAADKSLVVLPDCGHMMPLECGPASAAEAAAFLDRVNLIAK